MLCKLYLYTSTWFCGASQLALVLKSLTVNAGDPRDLGPIPGSGRSPRRWHGDPLLYSLESSIDRGTWWATARSQREESCPWQRSWGRKPDICKGMIWLQRFPLDFPEHLPPKTRVCLPYCTVLSTLLTSTGAVSHHLSVKMLTQNSNWSPANERNVSAQIPLMAL